MTPPALDLLPCAVCGESIPAAATTCSRCGGDPATDVVDCSACDGHGAAHFEDRRRVNARTLVMPETWGECPRCDGRGWVHSEHFDHRQECIELEPKARQWVMYSAAKEQNHIEEQREVAQ